MPYDKNSWNSQRKSQSFLRFGGQTEEADNRNLGPRRPAAITPIVPAGETVDLRLRSMMEDPRYLDPVDTGLRDHISREFAKAYPGDATYDATGRMERPQPQIAPWQVSPFDPDGVLAPRFDQPRTALLQPQALARPTVQRAGLENPGQSFETKRIASQAQGLGQKAAKPMSDLAPAENMRRQPAPPEVEPDDDFQDISENPWTPEQLAAFRTSSAAQKKRADVMVAQAEKLQIATGC